MCQSGEDMVLR